MTAVLLLPSLPFMSGCKTGFYYDNASKYESGEASFSAEAVEAIDVAWFNGEVNILFTAEEGAPVSVAETSDKKTDSETALHYWLDDTTLKIKFAASGKLKLSSLHKTLTVILPQSKTLAHLSVDSEASNVTLKDVRSKKLTVSAVSGNILLEGARISERADITTTSGNIHGNAVAAAENFKIKSKSGRIRFSTEARIRELSAETTSGNVFLSNLNPAKIARVDTVSGNVELEFLDNSGFSLTYDTVNGKLSTDLKLFLDGKKYVYGTPNAEFSVKTAAGNLSILSVST